MSVLDVLFGRRPPLFVRDGACVLRSVELVESLPRPQQPNFADEGPKACTSCGRLMSERLITTGGPHGDPEVWQEAPVAVDGWVCLPCRRFAYPRKMTADQIDDFATKGIEHGQGGRFAEAEWWFTRVVWDWPGYLVGHINLAEALRDRLYRSPGLEPLARRRLMGRMRACYEEAAEAFERLPSPELALLMSRTYLTLGELAFDERAFERSLRALRACLGLSGLDESSRLNALALERRIHERTDLFDAAIETLEPFLDYPDRPGLPVDTPGQRKAIHDTLDGLERHVVLAPDHWQAAWLLAMGTATLGDPKATLDVWGAASAAHPAVPDIAREYALELLRVGRNADARRITAAITAVVVGTTEPAYGATLPSR